MVRYSSVAAEHDGAGPEWYLSHRVVKNAEGANDGVVSAYGALRPDGVLAVWSAWEDRKFEQRLRWAGFTVKVHRMRARLKRGGPRHTIFVGKRASV